jgi:hypothetical protein
MGFDGNNGINRLANVLAQRMKKENSSSLILDFGEIQANESLITNTFPIPIPKGDYSVCKLASENIEAGSHVLVAWVLNEAVVVDRIEKS